MNCWVSGSGGSWDCGFLHFGVGFSDFCFFENKTLSCWWEQANWAVGVWRVRILLYIRFVTLL